MYVLGGAYHHLHLQIKGAQTGNQTQMHSCIVAEIEVEPAITTVQSAAMAGTLLARVRYNIGQSTATHSGRLVEYD